MEDYTDFYPNRSAGLEKHGDAYVQGWTCSCEYGRCDAVSLRVGRLGGYSTLVQRLAAGLDVRLQSPVSRSSVDLLVQELATSFESSQPARN